MKVAAGYGIPVPANNSGFKILSTHKPRKQPPGVLIVYLPVLSVES